MITVISQLIIGIGPLSNRPISRWEFYEWWLFSSVRLVGAHHICDSGEGRQFWRHLRQDMAETWQDQEPKGQGDAAQRHAGGVQRAADRWERALLHSAMPFVNNTTRYLTKPCDIRHMTIWSLFKNRVGPLKTKSPPNPIPPPYPLPGTISRFCFERS